MNRMKLYAMIVAALLLVTLSQVIVWIGRVTTGTATAIGRLWVKLTNPLLKRLGRGIEYCSKETARLEDLKSTGGL